MFGLGLNLSYSRGQFMNLPITLPMQTQLTTITYADSSVETFDITVIPDSWQSGNNNIISVVIGNMVTSIGVGAFDNCASLTDIMIPDSVTSIGEIAFSRCSSLTSVILPNGITNISNNLFSQCTSLSNIIIPNSVTSIGYNAFSQTSLSNIIIPNSVTSIGAIAFGECNSLTSVTIPSSVTNIGFAVFTGCTNLNTLNCYVTRSTINVNVALLNTASPFTIYARTTDDTWSDGSDTIGGRTVTVVKNL